jgi:hypothetical protein
MKRSMKLAVLLMVMSASAFAAKKVQTAPGKYEQWGPDIDRIEIVRSFKLADYSSIVIEAPTASASPESVDADVASKVEKVLRDARPSVVQGVKKKLKTPAIVEEVPADKSGVLLVRTTITTMDPGSRGKRIFIGYGAGAARTAVHGEIVDAASGAVRVRFDQERRSGMERFGRGSSYEEIMKRNLIAIGQDVANLLNEF